MLLHHCITTELSCDVLCSPAPSPPVQMTASQGQLLDMDHYLQKTYCKTASLMANSCRAVAVLGGLESEVGVFTMHARTCHSHSLSLSLSPPLSLSLSPPPLSLS